jgi:hypothetical protein
MNNETCTLHFTTSTFVKLGEVKSSIGTFRDAIKAFRASHPEAAKVTIIPDRFPSQSWTE